MSTALRRPPQVRAPVTPRTPDQTRRFAGPIAGISAAVVSLGLGELTAGLSRRVPSPILSVANEIIRRAPGSTSRSAVQAVGRSDKPLLIAGVTIGWLAWGVGVGCLGRRSSRAGVAAFAAVSLIAVAAALSQPDHGALALLLGAALALAAGIATLLTLLRAVPSAATHAGSGRRLTRADAEGQTLERRHFLTMAGAALAVGGSTAALGRFLARRATTALVRVGVTLPRAATPAASPPVDASLAVDNLSPLVTPNGDFYRIDTALTIPSVDTASWALQVKGMVSHPFHLTFDELLAMPMVEEWVTLTCVSNEVGGNLVGNARWLGVPLKDIVARAGVDPAATQIVGRSVDGFTIGVPTAVALDGRVAMVAVGMNGEPLPRLHGFPARLVIAGLYGYVSATKWLGSIEFTTLDAFDSYWIKRGWEKDGPIKTQSRIDVVRPGAGGDMLIVAGVAWAQTRGIRRVEVQVDGHPWVQARLAGELTADTWRQWSVEVPRQSGRRTIRVRATDGTGQTQPDRREDVFPNGASGYHTVRTDIP